MDTQIQISSAIFARLQKLAIPLVDSNDSVIARLIDYYERGEALDSSNSSNVNSYSPQRVKVFDCAFPPSLKHTKVLSAKLNGVDLGKDSNWNGLLYKAVHLANSMSKSPEELRRVIIINFVPYKKEDEGYRFLPETNLSVQGQDSNNAWKGIFHIAKQLGVPVDVEFVWRNKEDAEFPGATGRFIWK